MPVDSGNPQQPTHEDASARRGGQTVEFVRLFTEIAQRLYSYILVLLPNEDAASDVFQEVSVTLWERYDQYAKGTDFWAWAKQIAYYKVLHHRERSHRGGLHLDDAILHELAVEVDLLTERRAERNRALADCYSKLAPTDREVIERRYVAGATTEQVAAAMGHSVHQTYRALRRVHQVLFDCIRRALAEEDR